MQAISTKSGLPLPRLGFGTWGMGGRSERNLDNDDAADLASLTHALTQGVTHIDTAEIYANGYTETLVGQAIRGFERKNLILASKVQVKNLGYSDVIAACDRSLTRLKTDYVDLYYVHQRNPDIPLQETARGLNELLQTGKIKHVGVCNFNVASMQDLQNYLDVPIAANQSHYSLVYREPQAAGLLEHCQTVGAAFVAWRPLMWKNPNRTTPQPLGSAWNTGCFPMFDTLCAQYQVSGVQMALNWLFSQPNICTLVKTSKPKNMDDCLAALNWTLSTEHSEKLTHNFPDIRYVSDTVPLA